MSELIFLLSAELDIQQAFAFYEESQPGRGGLFVRHLDAALGQLRSFPNSGPVVHGAYRRLLMRGFPYAIFYSVEGRGLIISGVMDVRQDPGSILRRLR